MNRFVSQHTNRIDAKGRVSLPAPFREILAKDGFDGLYVHAALDFPALDCGGNALLQEIEALLSRFPAYSEERDTFSTALLGASQILHLDREGRFVVPDFVRETAGIGDSITFVGQGYKFQIWSEDAFKAHYQSARDRLRVLRRGLSVLPPATDSTS